MKKWSPPFLCIVIGLSILYRLHLEETHVKVQLHPPPQIASSTTIPSEAESTPVLVNQDNPIPESFECSLYPFQYGDEVFHVHESVAMPLWTLIEAAENQGVTLKINSTYRDSETQEALFSQKVTDIENEGYTFEEATEKAKQEVAMPEFSEHQTGLAIDFGDVTTYDWLREHAHHYGFILRYPEDKTHITHVMYEPWHFRYVGVEHAKQMHKHQLTLEEYLSS